MARFQFPRRNIGMLLLGIYLILVGLIALIPGFPGLGVVPAILALLAGIFILMGR